MLKCSLHYHGYNSPQISKVYKAFKESKEPDSTYSKYSTLKYVYLKEPHFQCFPVEICIGLPYRLSQCQQFNYQACCTGCMRRPFPDATPPIGKIHPSGKIAVTFEPILHLDFMQDLESPKDVSYSLFYGWKPYLLR